MNVQYQSLQKRFYRISALSMMAIGAAILLFSIWDTINPQPACQDTLIIDREGILIGQQTPCIDPMEIGQNSNDFIPLVLSICLMAFGAAILGMVTRY